MPHYDAIILGGGIAGASTAHALKQRGLRILLLEKYKIAKADSYAAGGFLSPKISKPSPYKSYLNDAFRYSVDFYKHSFPELFNSCGLLKLPLDEADIPRLQSYESSIDIAWQKKENNYFFQEAGLIQPKALIHALLQETEIKEAYTPKKISYHDSLWQIDSFTCTHLILATGSASLPINIPYLPDTKIGGYRYDVTFEGMEKLVHNTHKNLSFSCYHDSHVIVGATHIKEDIDLEKAAYHDSYNLLEKAKEIYAMPQLKILKSYHGYRRTTQDYFPIVGSVIDPKKTLDAYPYIQKGSKVPESKYITHPNLYVHTALASRGFVFAPYNAQLLAAHILDGKQMHPRLSPSRLFKKWARRTL